MDKDFIQYVYARIEKALTESKEYTELQSKCAEASESKDHKLYDELTTGAECKAEELCYLQGYQDGLRMAMTVLKTI